MANARRWFHPRLLGKAAEDLLLDKGQDGSFLVRPSQSSERDFTLSVRRGKTITHVKIQHTEEFYDLYGGEKFATLAELIEYYTENQSALQERDGRVINLRFPMLTEEVTSERWYHGIMTGKDAESLLLSRGQIWSFLVRASVHSPGAYVLSIKKDEKEVAHIKINYENHMYNIGDKQHFKKLEELVEMYRHAPMVEATGAVVRLKQPVNATRFITGNINERITDLMKVRSESYGKTGFWEEFEQLQQQECKNLYSRKEGSRLENRKKNRYKNILPFDATRVKLQGGDPDVVGSDYINANYITAIQDSPVPSPPGNPLYVATQGCVPDTVVDFWKMVYQENSRVIVMTTNEMERGKVKCQRYWPELQCETRYGDLLVQTLSEEKRPQYLLREIQVQKVKLKKSKVKRSKSPEEGEQKKSNGEEEEGVTAADDAITKKPDNQVEEDKKEDKKEETQEEINHVAGTSEESVAEKEEEARKEKTQEEVDNNGDVGSSEGGKEKDDGDGDDDDDDDDDDDADARTVYHYHFTIWPDHGVPQDPANVLVYLEDVNQKQKQLKDLELEPGPIIVHCSAGIGRTGTFIVIDMLLRRIEEEGMDCEVDIQKTILSLRAQRSGMVQTEAQYKFIYLALSHYIQTRKARNRVSDNYGNRSYPHKSGTSSSCSSSSKPVHRPADSSVASQEHLYTNLTYKAKEQNGTSEIIPAVPT